MKNSVNPKAEIALSISLIIFSGVVYYFSLELPDPVYEPLGSAALPKGLAVIMSLLSLIILVRAIPKIKTYKATTNTGDNVTSRPKLAILIFIITLIFIGILDFGILGFLPAGIIYLSTIGYFMTHRNLKRFPWVIAFSVILTVFSYYVFTKFFYIDLP
jgi:putative tricarboxylic transport membrane protein